MFRAFLRLIVTIPVFILLLGFMILNRHLVLFTYSPLHDPVMLPIMVIALACIIVGFLTGAWLVWLEGGAKRREVSQLRKQVKKLTQLSEIKNEISDVKLISQVEKD